MPNTDSNLKRNLLFNTAGNIVYFLCQWLITGFLVKRLAPDEQSGLVNAGLLAAASSAVNVFLTLASYGMRSFQVSDLKGRYTNGDYIASRAVTVTAAAVLCLAAALAAGYEARLVVCIAFFLVFKLIESVSDVFHGFAQKRDRMDIIGVSCLCRGVLSAVCFSAVYAATGNIVPALAVMAAVCAAFSAYRDIYKTRPYYLPTGGASARRVAALLLECLPLAAYSFLNTGAASIPKLVLERVWGDAVMGIYGLTNSPVLILQVGVSFMFAPFLTSFSRLHADGDKKGFLSLTFKICAGVAALTLAATAAVVPLGRWGLGLLYGEGVAAHSYLLPPMVLCSGLTSLVIFLCMLLTVTRCFKGLIAGTAAGIALSAAASALLVPSLGMTGTSLACLVALVCELAVLVPFLAASAGRGGETASAS